MTRAWRIDPTKLAALPEAIRESKKIAAQSPWNAMRFPVLIQCFEDLALDLRDALAAIEQVEAERDRHLRRVEFLEKMWATASTAIRLGSDPTRGFPARFSEGGPMPAAAPPDSSAGKAGPPADAAPSSPQG